MSAAAAARHSRMVRDLLEGDPEYTRLFHTSASFRTGVEFIVRSMIPTFVKGLASEAAERDAALEFQTQMFRQGLLDPLAVPR